MSSWAAISTVFGALLLAGWAGKRVIVRRERIGAAVRSRVGAGED
jgi:hypothetical protein